MNATNGHMFEGVDPRPAPPPHPLYVTDGQQIILVRLWDQKKKDMRLFLRRGFVILKL